MFPVPGMCDVPVVSMTKPEFTLGGFVQPGRLSSSMPANRPFFIDNRSSVTAPPILAWSAN